jgi:putative serine protease PepD
MPRSRRSIALLVVAAGAVAAAIVLGVSALTNNGSDRASSATSARPIAPPAGALALQNAFVKVVQTVSPSVVQIETSEGLGSGVVFDGKGDIVTNAHVVGTAKKFTVTTSSGKRVPATLVGAFPADDLAVIHVGTNLKAAAFGDSAKLQVGDMVLAIGNPLGLRSSVTQGIVSALARIVSEPTGTALPSAIQTSAAINPGNSGGALVDLEGRVVGIPTLAATDPQLGGGAAPGIGFAIPSNLVKDIAGQLARSGHVVDSGRAYLGILPGDTNGHGVLVGGVVRGSPAAKAGLKVGDVISSIAGKPTPVVAALSAVLVTLKPGQKIPVVVTDQSGKKRTVELTLGQLPG